MSDQTFYSGDDQDGYVRKYNDICGCVTVHTYYDQYDALFFLRVSCYYEDLGGGTYLEKYRRAFLYVDTSSLPGGATVSKIEFGLYYNASASNSARDIYIYGMQDVKSSYATDQDLFEGIDDGNLYFSGTSTGTPDVIDLGATAITDFNSHPTWFGVGITIDEASPPNPEENYFYFSDEAQAVDPAYRPYIKITYTTTSTNTNFLIMFDM